MDKKLDCAIVRDLLPSYVDGLSSDITNQAIEEHLGDCPDCAEALRRMRDPEAKMGPPAPEVDYLKKVRRRSTGRSLIIGIVLMLIGMTLMSFRIFYVGSAADASDVACHVTVEGDTVTVSGTLTSSGLGISRMAFSDSSGMVQVKVYTAPKAFFNHGDFTASYAAGSDVVQVRIDDLILWENGKTISNTAARLFQAMTPFVGNMPSNSKIAAILGVSDQFGPYTNELQTSTEPYGWTLCLETDIPQDEEHAVQDSMAADSYVMLATIGNLSYVTWEYQVDGNEQEYTVTAEDAAAYAGGDIKACAKSASQLQTLLESLGIK